LNYGPIEYIKNLCYFSTVSLWKRKAFLNSLYQKRVKE